MIRHLLALLAVLTGLAVAGAPLEARVCAADASEIGAVEAASVSDAAAPLASPSVRPAPADCVDPGSSAPQERRRTIHIPTVMLGGDRARE